MSKFKAIFFDRDNTITYFNPIKREYLSNFILDRTQKEYKLSYEEMMKLFDIADYPENGLKSIEEEGYFWKRYYYQLLKYFGSSVNLEEDAELLFKELWCNEDRVLFRETEAVMQYFKDQGLKIGIISDTSPSLKISLEQLGLGKYIDTYICSDLVGFMKPDARIFQAALDSIGVLANESIYVDDYDIEAEGARILGFTSFHIDRNLDKIEGWKIKTLDDLVHYYDSCK